MDDDNVTTPDEAVTPETDEKPAQTSQADADDTEDTGTETLETDGNDTPEEDSDADGDDPTEEGGEESDEPEQVEFKIGRDTLSLPKGAAAEDVVSKVNDFAHDLEAGYTKKFQDLAEQRKSYEEGQKALNRMQTLSDEALNDYAHGMRLQAEVEQLRQINLDALLKTNPTQASQIASEINVKTTQADNLLAKVQHAEAQLSRERDAEVVRIKQEGEQAVEKQIKGFKDKHLPAVIDYAVATLGVDREAATNEWAMNPPMAVAVYKAMQYDQLQAKAKKPALPKQAQAPVKPVKTSGAKASRKLDLNRDADKMSIDQWQRERQKQVAKKRAG